MSKFSKLHNPSSWRRISIANWRAPNDPTVYGHFPLEFSKGQTYLDTINQNSPHKITPTHLVAKAVAQVLKKYPDLNGIIRWNAIYLRNSIDVFLQVAIDAADPSEKPDLSGAKIEKCDQKSLSQIAEELKQKCRDIRQKEDPQFKKTLGMVNGLPNFVLKWFVKLLSFLIYNLDLSLPKWGLPHDPFGSVMVTSVGMFKAPAGYAPLVPISRVPLIICVGECALKPWVVDGAVVARPILDLTATFDHRFIDGLTGTRMLHYFKEILADPEKHLA